MNKLRSDFPPPESDSDYCVLMARGGVAIVLCKDVTWQKANTESDRMFAQGWDVFVAKIVNRRERDYDPR